MKLSLYLNEDSNLIVERNQFFQLLREHTDTGMDSTYYVQNIAHVDSVIHKAIGLVEQGEADELLALLEQERHHIYAHPCNTIDNEIALHNMLIQLYNKAYKEKPYIFPVLWQIPCKNHPTISVTLASENIVVIA